MTTRSTAQLSQDLARAQQRLEQSRQDLTNLQQNEQATPQEIATAERNVEQAQALVDGRSQELYLANEVEEAVKSGESSRNAEFREEGRSDAIEDIGESLDSGINSRQTMQTLEGDLSLGEVVELREEFDKTGEYPPGTNINFSDMPRVKDMPTEAQSSEKSYFTTYNDHIYGDHGGDTTKPLEMGESRNPGWNESRDPTIDDPGHGFHMVEDGTSLDQPNDPAQAFLDKNDQENSRPQWSQEEANAFLKEHTGQDMTQQYEYERAQEVEQEPER